MFIQEQLRNRLPLKSLPSYHKMQEGGKVSTTTHQVPSLSPRKVQSALMGPCSKYGYLALKT